MISSLLLYFTISHLFSFVCSILEAVLLSSTSAYIEVLKKKGGNKGIILETLKQNVDRPLAAILTINTCSHTFGAVGVGANVLALFGDKYVALGSIILTLTMLYWTEMLPKTLGALYWKEMVGWCVHPIRVMIWLTYPFVVSFTFFAKMLAKGKKIDAITEEDIRGALASGAKFGIIAQAEQEMVENIFRLADRTIGVIMIPRVDLNWVNLADGLEKNRLLILQGDTDRYLLCEGDVDKVVGVLETKDLLKAVWDAQHVDLAKIAKPPHFVHEHQQVFELMELFENTDCKMALVTDEYGVVKGVVSMDEVIDAIIKDIDEQGTSHYHQVNARTWLLDGKMPIDEFKEIFNFEALPQEERAHYRTLGGLCMTLLGAVPKQGDVVMLDPYRLEIIRVYRRRVEKILLTRRLI
ncbi:MAG: HlyC/CorC family transporter [Verrucomicrobia bacterium]|nr:HlyC/CorC family transporter [Verrucomicrobiota bacterium]MBS0645663.1 HlyC/CorC family transporter [Verrucomicrobiota bacterium]